MYHLWWFTLVMWKRMPRQRALHSQSLTLLNSTSLRFRGKLRELEGECWNWEVYPTVPTSQPSPLYP